MSNTCIPDVTPICAVFTFIGDTVTTSIDNELRVEPLDLTLHVMVEHVNIVKLVVSTIPLTLKSARILAAGGTLMGATEAIIVAGGLGVVVPRTHFFSERLVVGHVGSETA